MLKLTTKNILTQWIATDMRFRADDVPSRLDLIFTKKPEITESVTYDSSLDKNDHVFIELQITETLKCLREDSHKIGRLNYSRIEYKGMKQYFTYADWSAFDMTNTINEKWGLLLKT